MRSTNLNRPVLSTRRSPLAFLPPIDWLSARIILTVLILVPAALGVAVCHVPEVVAVARAASVLSEQSVSGSRGELFSVLMEQACVKVLRFKSLM